MAEATTSTVYLTAEAVLELDELRANVRDDSPSLSELFYLLQQPAPSPSFDGHESVSMLADMRSYSVLRNAIGESRTRKVQSIPEFHELVRRYLEDLSDGVKKRNPVKMQEAKYFCQALGNQLLNKQMKEVYQHREQSDSSYISHDAVL